MEAIEYRTISGGEDGVLSFWKYERQESLPLVFPKQQTLQEIFVNPHQLIQIKPLFQLHLSLAGQLQSVTLADDYIFVVTSEGFLTVIKGIYKVTEQQVEEEQL